jgi:hypothetical protein
MCPADYRLSVSAIEMQLRPRRLPGRASFFFLSITTTDRCVEEKKREKKKLEIKKSNYLLRKQVRGRGLEPRRDHRRDHGPLLGHVGVPVARGDERPGERASERGHFWVFSFLLFFFSKSLGGGEEEERDASLRLFPVSLFAPFFWERGVERCRSLKEREREREREREKDKEKERKSER